MLAAVILVRPVMSTASWWGPDELFALLHCLTDCYENNKELALQLLCSHDLAVLNLQVSGTGSGCARGPGQTPVGPEREAWEPGQ